MLDQHEISLSCLLIWGGIALGVLLLVGEAFLGGDLAEWGIAVLCLSCTYSGHRSRAAQGERLREAFEFGRDHERSRQELRSLH